MPYYKNAKQLLLALMLLFSALTYPAYAGNSAIHVRTAELFSVDDNYALTADWDISLSPVIEDALNKGVPLTFLLEFQLSTPRKYWFDDEIVTQNQHITLSYHALSRQYLVNRNNRQQSFANLQQAKEEISNIKAWAVVDKKLLKKGEVYSAAIKVRLDQTKLPKPVQVEAIGSDDWSIASERYRWAPVFSF